MDRRDFGRALVTGAAAAGLGGTAQGASARMAADAPWRVFPDLPVRGDLKIRTGGDYWIIVGEGGMTSKVSLDWFARMNVRHLTAKGTSQLSATELSLTNRLGDFLAADGPWDLDRLKSMQDDCGKAGMTMEGVRMDSAYIAMKPGPERDRYLDVIRDNIRKAGAAGAKLVSYHWTITPIRRNRRIPGRGGSTYAGFRLEPNWRELPVAQGGPVSSDDYWERIDYFLKGVVPVCREAGIKLACHPYDPGGLPLGYMGVAHWDSGDFAAAMRRYELTVDDVHNGFTYETAVAGAALADPNAQLPLLRYLAQRGKIAQVHFRNIRGGRNDAVETYIDEGDVNMLDVVRVLRDCGWEGSLLPDHVPDVDDNPVDPRKLGNYAYAFGYIEGLIRAARNEAAMARRATGRG
jgi:mannonate dehydratase